MVGLVALAVPITIMALVLTWAFRARRRYSQALHSPLATARGDVAIGSAPSIADAGQVPWRDLLQGLALYPEGPYHEGWMGTMLGLQTKWSTSMVVLEPHRMWGARNGREVKIRLGPDEKLEGGTEMYTNKHIRAITTVAVSVPAFELLATGGSVRAVGDVPAPVLEVLGHMGPSPDIWNDVTFVAGPSGITANRPIFIDPLNGWLYDLWLCERVATALGA